ncbi:DUF1542 domain-containing protein [Fructobacillus evanidus]
MLTNHKINVNTKEHYKMYKAGKYWLFASIAVASFGLLTSVEGQSAHADSTTTTSQSTINNTTSQTAGQSTLASQSTSQSVSASQSTSASQGTSQSISASQSTSVSQSTSQSISVSQSAAGNQSTSQSSSASLSTSASQGTSMVASQSTSASQEGLSFRVGDDAQTNSNQNNSATLPSDSNTDRSGVVNTTVPTTLSTTSVTVNVPDQVQNPNNYKKNPVDVSTYSQFMQAWNDSKVDYINLTSDITKDGSSQQNRPSSTGSVIINGNGHTLDLGGDQLYMGTLGNGSQNATLTLTNINLENGYSDSKTNNGINESFLYTDDGSHLTINVNNVSLSASKLTGNDPAKFIYTGVNSALVFSGTNVLKNTNEIARGASNIQFANNSKLIQQRPQNDFGNSAFWLLNNAPAGNTGYGNSFTIGDGATLDMEHYNNYVGNNVCLIYEGSYLSGIKAGDNVSWTQNGFRGFFSSTAGASNGQFIFGKNFNLNIPSTDATGSITLMHLNGSQSIVFNAGTQINIQTNHASDAIFWLEGSSTATFISPKSIHFARLNPDGTPGSPTTNFFYGGGPTIITNGTMQVWTGSDTASNKPNGNGQESFVKYTLTGSYGVGSNGTTTLTRADGTTVTNPSDLSNGNIREMQTQSIGVGQVYVQYKDQYGNNVGSPVLVTLPSDAYIGQYIALTNNDIINKNMPSNYIWALGNQIPASAKNDAQSKGSPDTTVDNGDSSGQANIAVVPVKGTSYTYNVYVYGVPETVTYQYVDVNNANNVLTPKSTTTQPPVLANYGNVINWADSYYTSTTVPDGYSYMTGYSGQPSTTTVGTTNNVVKIYVQGNWQTATESYQDLNGNTVTPNDQVTLTGRTGQVVTIPNGPATDYYALDHILVNGQIVTAGSNYTMTNGNNVLTYVYRSLDGEKASAKDAINNAAQAAIQKINAVTNLTSDQITTAIQAVQASQNKAIAAITAAKSESDITTSLNSGLLNMSRSAASLVIDGSAKAQNDRIAGLQYLSPDQKAKYEQTVTDDATALKADLNSNAASPNDVQAKQDAATTKLNGDESKAELDDYGTNILNQINQMPALSNQQKADAATAVQGIVGNGQNLIGVKTMLSDILAALKSSEDSLNNEKNKAQGESDAAMKQFRADYVATLEQYVVQADAQIDSLNLIDKDAAKETVRKTADAAEANINNATDEVSVINAEAAGEVAIAKNTADSTIDNATVAAENKVAALNNLQSGDKAAAKTNIESLQTSAKNNIASALHTTDVTTALTNGTNSIAQKASATVIQDAVAGADSAIDALKTMSATEKQSFKDKIASDATTYSNNLTAATNGSDIQTIENNGVAVIQADLASAVLKDYQENADNQLDAYALNATNAVSALPNLDQSSYLANIATDVKNGKAAIDGASSSSSVDDALGTAKRSIDSEQAAATLKSAQNVANAAVNAAAQSVNAVIGNLKPLAPAEITKYQDQVNDIVVNATTQINGETLPATVSSDQASAISKINGIQAAANLQNAKEAAVAVAKQAAADTKTAIGNLKPLKPEEITEYQGQVDDALKAVTNQINSETTTDAVTSDQTTFTNTTVPNITSAASLQNNKEDDNAQVDSYAQNAKNAIADKTGMPDLSPEQISDYDTQINTAVTNGKSSITGGQDTATVATNFQTAKENIDKIKAAAQAESDAIVAKAKNDADDAIDQAVATAQADVQKLNPLSDQAARLAAIKNDGDAAKTKIAADKNTADISNDQEAGLQTISNDRSAAILQSVKEAAIAAATQTATDAETAIGGLQPLKPEEVTKYQGQVEAALQAVTNQIKSETTTDAVTSDQTTFTNMTVLNIKNAASLQNAKDAAIAVATQNATDAKTAIGALKPLQPDEITKYQDQVDSALSDATTQINQEKTIAAVLSDQTSTTTEISGIKDAASLQNTKEDDNNQLDQYAQNAKNAIADKTGMPDLNDDQISGYDNQIVAAVSAGKSSINGGQDTTTVATNFQTAKNNIDKIQAAAQAQSTATVSAARDAANNAIDQAVVTAQAAVQKLDPLKDQAARLATIKSDGNIAKAKIAADANTASINANRDAGLNTIQADQDAATLESAKEAAIAAVTQAATSTKTAIGGLQPLQPSEIKSFQDQVDAAVTAATNQINSETTTDAVASDQANAINNTIAGIQTAASLQNVKEKDNAQLLQDGQTAKNKIAAMPDLTKDQIAQANSDIDSAVSNGQTAITASQNETDVNTNFQTAESNINKVTATAQSQSDNAVANAKTVAGDVLDKAAAAAKAAIDQLPVLKPDEKTTFKGKIDAAVTAAKNSIQNDTTVATVTADQNTGLTAISNQQVAATLQNAKEDSVNQLNAYAQGGRASLTKLPNLTDTQADQANTSITNAVTNGNPNINAATDLAGVTRALVAAEFAVNRAGVIAINQSNAALVSARIAAEAAVNAVAAAVKTTINNLSPLSDQQARLSQVDTDIANAKTALESTSATADVTAAQGKAIATLNADAANAQQKSSQEDAISRLQNYATNAETALTGMSGLSADNLATAKTSIESAVTNGDTNIQGASEHAAMASALIAAEQAIDAATTTAQNQSQQTLAQAQSDASAAIDAALTAAQQKLNHLSLSTDDQATQEKQLETDAGNAKTSINVATSLAAVTQAQQTGAQAINQDILSAEIDSLQTEAKKRLQAYADQTKKTIGTLPDLSGDSYTNAYNGIDALVTIWSGNITNTRNLADMQSALYSGATAINLVSLSAQANSQKIVGQERATAEDAINQAATTARQTISSLSPLSDKSTRLDQIAQDVKDADDALDAATNNQGFTAAQNAGTTAITNHVTAAQLKSAQEQADADLATYGQSIFAKITALPDLTDDQRKQASTDITNAVSQGKTSIDATTSQANVAPALAAAEKMIDGIQETAENNNQAAVTQAQSDADNAIDAAAKAAKATIGALTPLSDMQKREDQIDTDAKNAKDAIAKATTKADVTAAKNAGAATITNDTTAAQLQSAKEKADADLDTYGQSAKDAIKAMPDLTDDQRNQANEDIDTAVLAGKTNINAATDTNGVATALADGKAAVDKVQATAQSQSNAAVQQEQSDADAAIDAAVKQAKDTINSLDPLSDKAKRLAQVDTDADSAKKAIAQANNKTDITTAQNAGTATIAQDATDAQLKSTKEAKDATLAAYGQTAKDAIAKMPDLTQAQIDQANKDIDAAVSAGQGQIDVAPDADSAATALTNGEKSVDAVQAGVQNTSNTTVQQERDAADAAIDAAVKNANTAIEGMNPLADKKTPEGNVAVAAQAAKDAIAKAGNKTAITAAQNSGTTAITNETTAAQLQSNKEAAIATLTQAAQAAKDAIKVMPDLSTDQIAAANAAVDAAFNDGQNKINATTDDDGVSTALTNGETGIKNAQAATQAESDAIVAQERSAAKTAIDTAAQQATDKIDAMTPLSDKQSREDQVAKDAQNAKNAIDQAKNKVAITAAQTSGTDAINNDITAAQLQSTKETDKNTLTADGQTAKDAIGKMPDLTPDQITAFDSQIDAAVKAAQGQIDAAGDANGVATAFATGETNIQNIQQDAQNTSDAKVASERLTADNAIDAAVTAAKAAIEGMNPLEDKTTPESQVDAAAQVAKAAIASAKNQTDITAAQDSGTDAINKVTAAAQLQSTKEAAKATLAKYGQDAESAIAVMPDLTKDQIAQANSEIDADVKAGQTNIDSATDSDGVTTALKNGEAAVDAVKTTAQTTSATTVANEQKTASDAIDAAAAKAKAAIDALNPLSDKADREAQVDKDAAAAKAAINNATNQADITKAQNAGTDTLNTDTANAQLKSTKEAADATLAQHGADAKAAIAKMPDLTKDQIDQANTQIDAAVKAGQANIDGAADAAGVATALQNGENAVDAVTATAKTNSATTVTNEKAAANKVIDDAAAKAKATVDALNPLSDKAAREAQIDADASAAKAAIASATNQTDITKAQNAGTDTLNTDTANAQLKSTKEAADATLAQHGQDAKDAIAKMPDLTPDQIKQADSDIDAAVKAGQANIDGATDANGVATALQNGEAAVDAVQTKSQSNSDAIVKTAKDAANSAIDDAAAKAKATIDALSPLSDKADRENQVDADANAAKQKIAQDTTTEQVVADQTSGLNAINSDVTAAQVKSAQEDATARLRAYADNAEAAIAKLPDLPAADLADAKAKIEAAVTAGNQAITAAQTVDNVKSALTAAEQAIDGVSTTAQSQSNQVISDAKQDAKNAIADATAKAKATIENLSPLSETEKQAQEAQVDQDAKTAAQNIDNATDTDAITQAKQTGVNNINQDVLNSQIENAQRDAAARLLAYANQAKQTIAALPDLTKDQIDQANADIDAKVKTWTDNINQTQSIADVQTALADGEKAIDDTSLTSQSQSQQTVTKEKNAANSVIDDAAAKAKAAIDGMNPLSDKAAREAQIDTDAAAAKTAINNATNQADITKAQNAGTDTLNTDTAAAQLKSQKEAADAELTNYGQAAKDKIAAMPDLTPDQIKQADSDIDTAVKAGQVNIDGATDADGVAKALKNGEDAVDAIKATAQTNSDTTVTKEKNAANNVIDDAAAKAKATIDTLNPLSDKADREAQVDKDAAAAKTAINSATNEADITKAQNAGTDALKTDTANAQLKSTKEAADAELAKYGQDAKNKIAVMPDLTKDQIDQANAEIDAAVKAGQANIDGAANADAVTTALKNGKAAVDAVQAQSQNSSDTIVKTAKDAANSAIDDAAAKAKATIDALNPLSDKADREAQVDKDTVAAKQKIAQDTTTEQVTTDQNSGLNAINNDVAAAQVKSAQEDAVARLRAYADNAEAAIAKLPDLPATDLADAKAKIEAAVTAGNQAITATQTVGGAKSALTAAEQAIDGVSITAQGQSNQVVSGAKQDAKNAIEDAAAKAKATIENLSPLSEQEKQAKETQVDQDAKEATQNIDNATDTDAITQAKQTGINNINQDVLNSQLENAQRDAVARLLAYANQAKQTIAALPDLTKDQINQANADIDAKVQTWTNNINQAPSVADVQTALANGEKDINNTSLIAQGQSQQTVTKEKNAANSVIDDATAKAKAAIDALDPLSDKADREAQVDKDAQNAKAAIANATNQADITKAQKAGTDTLDTDTAAAQLKSQKEAADADLAKYGQAAKDKIAAMPDLSPDQIKQADSDIDAAVKAGQGQIDSAADVNGVTKALADGKANVDKVQETAQTNSDTTVAKEKNAANSVIDDAAAKAKAAIDGLTPLSDKAAREAQIDTDAATAKAAIAKATNKADIDTAQKAGTDTLNTDTAAAQLKSQKEAADAALVNYGQDTKNKIAALPDLTKDQINQANADIDAAVKAGQANIDGAADANGVASALKNGESAVDAVKATAQTNSETTVAKEKATANSAIDDAAAKAKAAIDGLTPLSDKAAREAQIDTDAQNAKAAIAKGTNAADINRAQKAGTDALNTDTAEAQLKSTKEAADAALANYGQAAKAAIAKLPDLTPDQLNQANAQIDAAVKAGQGQIDAATDANSVATALQNGKTAIDKIGADAASSSGEAVAKAKTQAKTEIDNAGGQAKATIDGLTALVDAQKGADKAKVDQDAAAAKAKIDQSTTTEAIKQALDDGLATIQKDVENSILDNTKGEADSQLAGYAQAAKDKIAKLPNLTPAEVAQADREIDEIVAQGKKAIDQAAAENEVKASVQTNKEKIDGVVANAQTESDRQKPVAKVAEPAPTPQPQPAPKQTPVLPMTSRLQKHHTDTTLLPLATLGLLAFVVGKRRRQRDDKK